MRIDAARPGLDAVDGFVELRAVIGEVGEHDAAGREDSGAARSVESCIEMAVHCLMRVEKIATGEMDVIDQIGDVAIGKSWLGRSRRSGLRRFARGSGGHWRGGGSFALFHREFRDELRLAFVEELEVFLLEITDGVAIAIAHDDRDGNEVDAGAKSDGRFFRGNLGLIRRRGGLRPGGEGR